jgi:ABC-type glycerol-3-phosphate transport system permease component
MWLTIVLSFLTGVLGANSLPHFVKGITKETYPTAFGSSPVVNLMAGWSGFILTALCAYAAHFGRHPFWGFVFAAIGVLLMGLFHARIGAFGRAAQPSIGQPGSSLGRC